MMRTLVRLVVALLILVPTSRAAAPTAEEPRGWLGLLLADAEESSAGVLVRGVVDGSPADRARFRAKDTILAVDGTAVSGAAELVARIHALDPGSFATFSVKRGGRDFELKTVLGTPGANSKMVRGWLGVGAIELPPSLRVHFGAPQDAGVLVSEVSEGSPAHDSGIRVGDVIYEADGEPVTSSRMLSRLVSEAGVENVIDVVLSRDGARIVVGPAIGRAPAPAAEP